MIKAHKQKLLARGMKAQRKQDGLGKTSGDAWVRQQDNFAVDRLRLEVKP